jgi:hypothetical protein
MVTISLGSMPAERRFAIAHELGHFELHKSESYLGLCTGDQLITDSSTGSFGAMAAKFGGEERGCHPGRYRCPRLAIN